MAKFNEKTFLNFTAEDYDVSEVMDDYREAIHQEICSIGDLFFFYQKSFFNKSVVCMKNVIWMYPYREAPKGRGGANFYNDLGKIRMYDSEGNAMDFTFPTPSQSESIYSMLASTFAEENHILTGMSSDLQRAMEQGCVDAFRAKFQELKAKQQANQMGQ